MTGTVSSDVSEFQVPVDDSYNRSWLIFRLCDGDYIDAHAAHNLAWSKSAKARRKIQGFTAYVVYRPGKNSAILHNLNVMGVPTDCMVMIDAESWGGQITGNHSSELAALANALRQRQGGRADLVWGYGNRGPDMAVWPDKPSWMTLEVASFGGGNPGVAHEGGWQYTDGTYSVPGLPNSSPPFGHCDHNVLYTLPTEDTVSATDVITALGSPEGQKLLEEASSRATRQFLVGTDGHQYGLLTVVEQAIAAKAPSPAAVAAAVVAALPAGTAGPLTAADVQKAVTDVLNQAQLHVG